MANESILESKRFQPISSIQEIKNFQEKTNTELDHLIEEQRVRANKRKALMPLEPLESDSSMSEEII